MTEGAKTHFSKIMSWIIKCFDSVGREYNQ